MAKIKTILLKVEVIILKISFKMKAKKVNIRKLLFLIKIVKKLLINVLFIIMTRSRDPIIRHI